MLISLPLPKSRNGTVLGHKNEVKLLGTSRGEWHAQCILLVFHSKASLHQPGMKHKPCLLLLPGRSRTFALSIHWPHNWTVLVNCIAPIQRKTSNTNKLKAVWSTKPVRMEATYHKKHTHKPSPQTSHHHYPYASLLRRFNGCMSSSVLERASSMITVGSSAGARANSQLRWCSVGRRKYNTQECKETGKHTT